MPTLSRRALLQVMSASAFGALLDGTSVPSVFAAPSALVDG